MAARKLFVQKAINPIESYDSIVSELSDLIESARRVSARSVNAVMTASYWEIGRRIVESEQRGKKRAGYGEVCGPHKALVKFGISYPVPRNPATHAIAAPAAGVRLAASHRKPKRCAVADDVASGRCGEMAADDKDRLVGPLGEKA